MKPLLIISPLRLRNGILFTFAFIQLLISGLIVSPLWSGSLWQSGYQPYGAGQGLKSGSIIRMKLDELVDLKMQNEWEAKDETRITFKADAALADAMPGLDHNDNNSKKNIGKGNLRQKMAMEMALVLGDRDEATGLFSVSGARSFRWDNKIQVFKVAGSIDPKTIAADGSVSSRFVANLQIEITLQVTPGKEISLDENGKIDAKQKEAILKDFISKYLNQLQ